MFVYPAETTSLALELVAAGLPDAEVASATGVPRRTISDWRRFPDSVEARAARHQHDFERLPARDYSYLLGLYLGDGCVSPSGNTWRLRVVLDAKYPRILLAAGLAMEMTIPGKRAHWQPRRDGACVEVSMWSSHWPCLLPQHGPGRKHERRIELVDWQRDLVSRAPRELLAGLIHSDGCRVVARYRESGRERLRPRYVFSNLSEDIKAIFCDACDEIGVQWNRSSDREITVARAASVEVMDGFLGPKR